MFKHLIVAVDFSSATDVLLGHLPQLRAWGVERVTLVHVLASGYPQAPAETHRAHYDGQLAERAAKLAETGLQAGGAVVSGVPSTALHEAALRLGADAVMIGSHGHNTLRDLFLGSTVLNLARITTLPMLLIPVHAEPPSTGPLATVVLGSDCSEAGRSAEAFFVDLVCEGARGVAVCVIERGADDEREAEGHCAAEHAKRLTDRCGGRLETRVEFGMAAKVILDTARRENAQLVVVGKRGHNRLRELLLGSTAEAVCRGAAVPVALIPTKA